MKIEKNKFLFLFLFCYSTVNYTNAQVQLKNIEIGKNVPSQWKDSIMLKGKWSLVDWGSKDGIKVDQGAMSNNDVSYKFMASSCEILPGTIVQHMQRSDTFKTFNVTYFPEEKTLSITLKYTIGFSRDNYKVVYLQSGDLILEKIDDFHFDNVTGKILSDEQSEKRIEEINRKSGPGLFGNKEINIGGKKAVESRHFLILNSVN